MDVARRLRGYQPLAVQPAGRPPGSAPLRQPPPCDPYREAQNHRIDGDGDRAEQPRNQRRHHRRLRRYHAGMKRQPDIVGASAG